ncbi:hypothetical protein HG531_004862 [Fusarium graminearum]|nr:hypothetical protein HG531_004862 [Fusarium graminearum]
MGTVKPIDKRHTASEMTVFCQDVGSRGKLGFDLEKTVVWVNTSMETIWNASTLRPAAAQYVFFAGENQPPCPGSVKVFNASSALLASLRLMGATRGYLTTSSIAGIRADELYPKPPVRPVMSAKPSDTSGPSSLAKTKTEIDAEAEQFERQGAQIKASIQNDAESLALVLETNIAD